VWDLVEQEGCNTVMITGDAMGKPMIESLDDPGTHHDLSSLSPSCRPPHFQRAVKDQLLRAPAQLMITDAVGSFRGCNNGSTSFRPGTRRAERAHRAGAGADRRCSTRT